VTRVCGYLDIVCTSICGKLRSDMCDSFDITVRKSKVRVRVRIMPDLRDG
jgi:hypothetical protein